MTTPSTITHMLTAWQHGDTAAGNHLMDLVYGELRRMACRYLQGERFDHTLQASALVNETYLRLLGNTSINWRNRSQFYALSARAMRRILVEYARTRGAKKRGGDAVRVPFEETDARTTRRPEQWLALDDALKSYSALDPAKARIVELRFFAGLEMQEIAQVTELSIATVNRHWRVARAWLAAELETG